MNANTMHLGHPLLFSYKNRSNAYSFIFNKFRATLSTLKANKINHAGRLVYINSVLSSIPIYYLTNILFPENFLDRIEAIMRNFWWAGHKEENDGTNPIAFRSWDDICSLKSLEGWEYERFIQLTRV